MTDMNRQKDLFENDLPIHVMDDMVFKNRFWDVFQGREHIGYISHNVNNKYSYNDLTKPLLKRTRTRLSALDYEDAIKETKGLLQLNGENLR